MGNNIEPSQQLICVEDFIYVHGKNKKAAKCYKLEICRIEILLFYNCITIILCTLLQFTILYR